MSHPENMPSPDSIEHPISQAEIAKQGHELESQDVRAEQLMAHQALIADPESIKAVGELLTGSTGPARSAMDSDILRRALHIEEQKS